MANFNFNKAIVGGRLTSDPELKQTTTGISVTTFTVAVNRKASKAGTERAADFITCVAWRNTAEFITKFFRKGSSICVVGSIQTRTWTDAQNQKRYSTEVVVEEASFVDSIAESRGAPGGNAAAAYNPYDDAYASQSFSSSAEESSKFEELINDDDLPF